MHSSKLLHQAYTVLPQRQRRPNASYHHRVASRALQRSDALAIDPSEEDVWTADAISPQQRKAAQLHAAGGPLIPKFLVKHTEYNSDDFLEVGFVWKSIGTRGELLLRVCTSLQDYRVGLAGQRYLLPWTGDPHDAHHPMATDPPPALYRTRMRRAVYKVHNIADVRHNVWQIVLEGCCYNVIAQRLQGWRVFMHVADIPGSDILHCGERTALSTSQHETPGDLARPFEVNKIMLKSLDVEDVRDFLVYVSWPRKGRPKHQNVGCSDNFTSNIQKHEHDVSAEDQNVARNVSKEESRAETPAWLQGATCIGRITDIHKDEKRFYDTGPYIDRLGYQALPGDCPVFRVAFRKTLVLHAFHASQQYEDTNQGGSGDIDSSVERFVELESLKQAELLQV